MSKNVNDVKHFYVISHIISYRWQPPSRYRFHVIFWHENKILVLILVWSEISKFSLFSLRNQLKLIWKHVKMTKTSSEEWEILIHFHTRYSFHPTTVNDIRGCGRERGIFVEFFMSRIRKTHQSTREGKPGMIWVGVEKKNIGKEQRKTTGAVNAVVVVKWSIISRYFVVECESPILSPNC